MNFFGLSLKRAFRLDIHPDEVSPAERGALLAAGVTAVNAQAFLAWRRSVHFVVAVFMVPLLLFRGIEVIDPPDATPDTLAALGVIQWLVEIIFVVILWALLKSWTRWRQQRRILLGAFLFNFLTPFLLWLYPLRSTAAADLPEEAKLGVGMVGSVMAIITLAPKAVSVMPGLLRGSIAAKLLFPGAAAPGWLMVLAAPIYTLLLYVVLLIPYQITGSGLFVLAVIGFIGAQVWLARSGVQLARPLTHDHSAALIKRARVGYLIGNLTGGFFVFIALIDLLDKMPQLGVLSIVNLGLAFLSNVFLLTIIATDLVLSGLDRARGSDTDPAVQVIRRDYEAQMAAFHIEPGSDSQR